MDEPFLSQTPTAAPWPRWKKLLASGLVTLHVAAVFIAPMSFAVRPGSPAIDPLRGAFRPYLQALFLDHGYAFFAPDPGPSHLVEYRLEFPDERPAETGRFPDVQTHIPRLLYHRHFMLSESLQSYYAPEAEPQIPQELSAEERSRELAQWRLARQQFEALRDSYARHLAAAHHAERAEVHRVRHDFLPPSQFTGNFDPAAPRKLNDPRTYRDLDAPLPAAETLPANDFVPGLTPLPRGGP